MVSVTVIIAGNESGNQTSKRDRDCVPFCANALRKGMNLSILSPSIIKQSGFFSLDKTTNLERKTLNSNLQYSA